VLQNTTRLDVAFNDAKLKFARLHEHPAHMNFLDAFEYQRYGRIFSSNMRDYANAQAK